MSSTGSEILRAVDAATVRHQAHIEEAERLGPALYEDRPTNIDRKLVILTWLVAINIIVTLGVLWRLLAHWCAFCSKYGLRPRSA